MTNRLGKLMAVATLHESTIGRISVLAIEYVDKQISAERFAARCVELLEANRDAINELTKVKL